MNSVSEKIDIRILRLLGLTDVFDLDYDTYLTLLREAIVFGAGKLPQEELALLSNERKRIRSKKGRFKPRPKKITANSIVTTKFLNPSVQPISTPLIAPSLGGVQQPTIQPVNLAPLQAPLESIKQLLQAFLDHRKGVRDDERRNYENQRRVKREEGLENVKKGMSQVGDAVKKFVSPFQNIIERIKRFIFFTLLGRAFTQLIGWFKDPKNRDKVDTLKRFIKDWWPTLLGAFVLFFTPFGGFVRGILRIVGGLTGKLVGAIPRIASAIRGLSRVLLNPWVAIPAAVAGTAILTNEITGQREAAGVQTENKARAQTGQGLGVQGTDTMSDRSSSVGNMGPTTSYGLLQGNARGGSVLDGYFGINSSTGYRIAGFGPDTQLIAAQPGEIVINKSTVDAIGSDTFLSLNRYYGGYGANQPKFGRLFNTGGQVGEEKNKNPKISEEDYYSLLAISSLEDVTPQGRADVAQSIYNRLHAVSKYRMNFSQMSNRLKDIIIAPGQYEPTFKNSSDWRAIKDRKSAALAVMNSEKGRRYGWTLKDAMNEINSTEIVLKNVGLQSRAQRHVGGRPFFLGTSQHKSMKKGDVLRDPTANFFSPWYSEGSSYDKERRNVAAPIPLNLLPKTDPVKNKQKLVEKRPWYDPFGWFGGASRVIQKKQGGGILTPITKEYGIPIKGMGVDTQFNPYLNAALQPGEKLFKYVLTKKASDSGLGEVLLSLADSFQSELDSQSIPALLKKEVSKPKITPLPNERDGTITLPAIEVGSNGFVRQTIPGGTRVPSFNTRSPKALATISGNMSIYGIRESFVDSMYGSVG